MANKPHLIQTVAEHIADKTKSTTTQEDGWRFLEKSYPKTSSSQTQSLDALASQHIQQPTSFTSLALATKVLLKSKNATSQNAAWALYTSRVDSQKAEDIALRRIIASTSTSFVSPTSQTFALTFLSDTDPEVRALGHSYFIENTAENSELRTDLEKGLLDPWPMVQIGAIGALVARCKTPANLLPLTAAVLKIHDKSFSTYVSGLLKCNLQSTEKLFTWVDDASFGKDKRATIAKQLVSLAPKYSDHFRAMFKNWFNQRLENETALKLAIVYTRALGKDGHKDAKAMLWDAASDPAFPSLVAASLQALANDCSPKNTELFRRLSSGYEPIVVKASQLAIRGCEIKK